MKDDRTVSTVPAAPITRSSPMSLSGHSRGYCDIRLLADDEGVPLICPTCQVLAQSVLAGARLLLCMGLFSIFLVGSQRRGCEISCFSDEQGRGYAVAPCPTSRRHYAKTTPKPLIGLDETARMDSGL